MIHPCVAGSTGIRTCFSYSKCCEVYDRFRFWKWCAVACMDCVLCSRVIGTCMLNTCFVWTTFCLNLMWGGMSCMPMSSQMQYATSSLSQIHLRCGLDTCIHTQSEIFASSFSYMHMSRNFFFWDSQSFIKPPSQCLQGRIKVSGLA